MILDADKALKIAHFLLRVNAVQLNIRQPFTWSSGWKSPIYCDNRVLLSHPQIRTAIRQTFAAQIAAHYPSTETIAAVATGGIAIGALTAEEMGLPLIYVRPSEKTHGMGNQIEGHYNENQRTVVIEDLVSTGGSCLRAVQKLRDKGLNVLGAACIFSYGFDETVRNFATANCRLLMLSSYDHLIASAQNDNYINKEEAKLLEKWRSHPESWNP